MSLFWTKTELVKYDLSVSCKAYSNWFMAGSGQQSSSSQITVTIHRGDR